MNDGDRIWLNPDRKEVLVRSPGVIVKVLPSGRARIRYVDMGCVFSKTVEQKRLEHRAEPCPALKEKD